MRAALPAILGQRAHTTLDGTGRVALPGTNRVPYYHLVRFPEMAAGGFSRIDGTVAYYQRVAALMERLGADATVVDFGAGRGYNADDPVAYRRKLRNLRGPGRRVIGLDVDPAVEQNITVDTAMIIDPSDPLPLGDSSVDLLNSDFVFEHIDRAEHTATELARVVRPGGWVCARTPNKWGFIALGARLVPNKLHVAVLRRLQPKKAPEDTFETRYKLNTRKAITRHFGDEFEIIMYTWDSEPSSYTGRSRIAPALFHALRFLPPSLRSMWFIYMQRRPIG